ncbi:predicted protein [Histoplasma capsulatum H143]|uniref:Uncharacterized protein n=1 Tax=Ajellomyces capsulatus (strain H143) TaxID=544712 RepID=C6HTB7_AJECH|nr:predicted protein [Histoplasma capsulatum H143]
MGGLSGLFARWFQCQAASDCNAHQEVPQEAIALSNCSCGERTREEQGSNQALSSPENLAGGLREWGWEEVEETKERAGNTGETRILSESCGSCQDDEGENDDYDADGDDDDDDGDGREKKTGGGRITVLS